MHRYRVYRNLTKGKISILDPETGLVIGHADTVALSNAVPIVNDAGRQKCIERKRKFVHAFVEGAVISVTGFQSFKDRLIDLSVPEPMPSTGGIHLTYNPYHHLSFVERGTDLPAESQYRFARVGVNGVTAFK